MRLSVFRRSRQEYVRLRQEPSKYVVQQYFVHVHAFVEEQGCSFAASLFQHVSLDAAGRQSRDAPYLHGRSPSFISHRRMHADANSRNGR
jgi:hypothetical protein